MLLKHGAFLCIFHIEIYFNYAIMYKNTAKGINIHEEENLNFTFNPYDFDASWMRG